MASFSLLLSFSRDLELLRELRRSDFFEEDSSSFEEELSLFLSLGVLSRSLMAADSCCISAS
jgi:hypothetical protein